MSTHNLGVDHRAVPTPILDYFSHHNPALSDRTTHIFDELVSYLSIEGANPVPSAEVDEAWHTFLLHTKDYDEFCRNYVGRFVHHVPSIVGQAQSCGNDCASQGCSSSCQRLVAHD